MGGTIDVIITDGEVFRRYAVFNWYNEGEGLTYKLLTRDAKATYHPMRTPRQHPGYSHIKMGGSKFARGTGPPLEDFDGFGTFGNLPNDVVKDEIDEFGYQIKYEDIDNESIVVDCTRCEHFIGVIPFIASPNYPISKIMLRIAYFNNQPVSMDLEGIRIRNNPWVGILTIPDKMGAGNFIPKIPRTRYLENDIVW